jgi:hypothetical protein
LSQKRLIYSDAALKFLAQLSFAVGFFSQPATKVRGSRRDVYCMIRIVLVFSTKSATKSSAATPGQTSPRRPKETPLDPCFVKYHPIPVCQAYGSISYFSSSESVVYSEITNWIAFQDICPASVRVTLWDSIATEKNQSSLFQKFHRSRTGLYPQDQPLEFSHAFFQLSCITLQLSLNRNNGLLLLPSTWVSLDPVPPNATPSNVKTVHMKREGIVVPPYPFSRHNTAPDETETSFRMLEDYTKIFMRGAPR